MKRKDFKAYELSNRAWNIYNNNSFVFYKDSELYYMSDCQGVTPRILGSIDDVEQFLLSFFDKKPTLESIEAKGTYYNENLRIGGQGTCWVDEENGLLYEFRSDNPDFSVEDLTDEEIDSINEQIL